jgi:hypothetical protein
MNYDNNKLIDFKIIKLVKNKSRLNENKKEFKETEKTKEIENCILWGSNPRVLI